MEEKQKYELTDFFLDCDGHTVYMIRALRDILSHEYGVPPVRKGDLGGYVESEANLSQAGDCWVYNHAVVMENACIAGNTMVCDTAVVRGNVEIFGYVVVKGNAVVNGVHGSYIMGDVKVADSARLTGKFCISGKSVITSHAVVHGQDIILSSAVELYGHASVTGNVHMYGHITLANHARVVGPEGGEETLTLTRDGEFVKDDVVRNAYDYFSMYNQWSSNRMITYMTNSGMWNTGCFRGTRRQLVLKAFDDSFVKGLCFWRATRIAKELCWLRKLTISDPATRLGRLRNWIFGEMN